MKLVVLDFDGVLFERHRTVDNPPPNPDFTHKYFSYYIYPGVHQFIQSLLEKYDVGFLTSITEKNTLPILRKLYANKEIPKFKFILDRRFVKHDPEYKKFEKINFYDTIKLLSDIHLSSTINLNRVYNTHNTIIIDDSYMKMRFNHPKNVILFTPIVKQNFYVGYNYRSGYLKKWPEHQYTKLSSYEEILNYITSIGHNKIDWKKK